MLFLFCTSLYSLDLLLQEIQSKAAVSFVKSRIYNLSVPKEKCEEGGVERSEEFGVWRLGYLSSGAGMLCFCHPCTCDLLRDSIWDSSHSKAVWVNLNLLCLNNYLILASCHLTALERSVVSMYIYFISGWLLIFPSCVFLDTFVARKQLCHCFGKMHTS